MAVKMGQVPTRLWGTPCLYCERAVTTGDITKGPGVCLTFFRGSWRLVHDGECWQKLMEPAED